MTANFRLLQNNWAAAEGATVSASSALASFPVSFSVAQQRYKRWMPQGAFRIKSTNKKIYINDGSDKTITLTEAVYTSGALMAAHIQTQLNASSSNWTATYSTTTWKFTIGRSSGTANLRFGSTTDAAWSTLGYTGSTTVAAGTGLAADEARNHTSERWAVDLGAARNVTAFRAIGECDADFTIPDTATCVLKASTIDDYDSAPYSVSLTPTDTGIVKYLDETYRYWWFDFIDTTNTAGAQSYELKIYLGDYVSPVLTNLNLGFARDRVDPSKQQKSDAGVPFTRLLPKYWVYSSLQTDWICDTDRTEIERVFGELGTSTPFYVDLDPDGEISAYVGEFNKYVTFQGSGSMRHLRHKYFAGTFTFVEQVG